jgi:hypothetical protein
MEWLAKFATVLPAHAGWAVLVLSIVSLVSIWIFRQRASIVACETFRAELAARSLTPETLAFGFQERTDSRDERAELMSRVGVLENQTEGMPERLTRVEEKLLALGSQNRDEHKVICGRLDKIDGRLDDVLMAVRNGGGRR